MAQQLESTMRTSKSPAQRTAPSTAQGTAPSTAQRTISSSCVKASCARPEYALRKGLTSIRISARARTLSGFERLGRFGGSRASMGLGTWVEPDHPQIKVSQWPKMPWLKIEKSGHFVSRRPCAGEVSPNGTIIRTLEPMIEPMNEPINKPMKLPTRQSSSAQMVSKFAKAPCAGGEGRWQSKNLLRGPQWRALSPGYKKIPSVGVLPAGRPPYGARGPSLETGTSLGGKLGHPRSF